MSDTPYDPKARAWFEHMAKTDPKLPLDADNFVDGAPMYKDPNTENRWRWFDLGFRCQQTQFTPNGQ